MGRANNAGGLTAGAILPHAPLLIRGVAGSSLDPKLDPIRSAAGSVDLDDVDAIVVLSPHGSADGVYSRTHADLSRFGVPEASMKWGTDRTLSTRLATAWGVEMIDDEVDHGVAVPVALTAPRVPVVGACLDESSEDPAARAEAFVAALGELSAIHRLAFVASVNTSAGLTPRAPLTELSGARDLEAQLESTLESDAGGLGRLVDALATSGGSCGAGPLTAFGALFAGRSVDILAHAWPVGVGYVVAAVRN